MPSLAHRRSHAPLIWLALAVLVLSGVLGQPGVRAPGVALGLGQGLFAGAPAASAGQAEDWA
ncbi:MAG: hypothetical protein M3Q65_07440, partial [Chloroflexota bacterium]|nr:hypothetical protein [Chloroflexota bacterium]